MGKNLISISPKDSSMYLAVNKDGKMFLTVSTPLIILLTVKIHTSVCSLVFNSLGKELDHCAKS